MSHNNCCATPDQAAEFLGKVFNTGVVHSYQDIRKTASDRLYGGDSFFSRISASTLRRFFLDDKALANWEDRMWNFATVCGGFAIFFAFIGYGTVSLVSIALGIGVLLAYLPERFAARHFDMWDSSWDDCPDCFAQKRKIETAFTLCGLDPWDFEIVFPRRPVKDEAGQWSCTRVALVSFKDQKKRGLERGKKSYFEFGSTPIKPIT